MSEHKLTYKSNNIHFKTSGFDVYLSTTTTLKADHFMLVWFLS